MKKILVLLTIGVVAGYWLGFKDAQSNTDNVVTRLINHTGGKTRNHVRSNADGLMDSVESH